MRQLLSMIKHFIVSIHRYIAGRPIVRVSNALSSLQSVTNHHFTDYNKSYWNLSKLLTINVKLKKRTIVSELFNY